MDIVPSPPEIILALRKLESPQFGAFFPLNYSFVFSFFCLLPDGKLGHSLGCTARKAMKEKKKKKILKDDKFMADILVSFNIVNNVAGNKKIDHFQLIFYITE